MKLEFYLKLEFYREGGFNLVVGHLEVDAVCNFPNSCYFKNIYPFGWFSVSWDDYLLFELA